MEDQPAAADTPAPADTAPTARLLTSTHDVLDDPDLRDPNPRGAGVRWKMTEAGRQLDANLVRLPPRARVDTHAEPELDVMVLVLAGAGELGTPAGAEDLAEGSLVWLPRGSTRSLKAGPDGMAYLTVHRRRPGMQIRGAGG